MDCHGKYSKWICHDKLWNVDDIDDDEYDDHEYDDHEYDDHEYEFDDDDDDDDDDNEDDDMMISLFPSTTLFRMVVPSSYTHYMKG